MRVRRREAQDSHVTDVCVCDSPSNTHLKREPKQETGEGEAHTVNLMMQMRERMTCKQLQ